MVITVKSHYCTAVKGKQFTYLWKHEDINGHVGALLNRILFGIGTTVFRGKFLQTSRAILPNSAAHRGKFSTYRNLSSIAPWTWLNMQYLSPAITTDRYSLSTKQTGNISDKFNICNIPPIWPEWQSCISWRNVYIQWLIIIYGLLNPTKISTKFCKNTEILRKLANSVARLKILSYAENCGPYQLDPSRQTVLKFQCSRYMSISCVNNSKHGSSFQSQMNV